MSGQTQTSEFYQYQVGFKGLITKIVLKVNAQVCRVLMEMTPPTLKKTVLDIGVTSDGGAGSNFFEKLYPYPQNITAVGLEDASFLEKDFPGLKFIRLDGKALPFADKSFDLVVSFATLEHVGSREQQTQFVKEACRVGKSICIVIPNRWYPIEFHTLLPFVHWLPAPWFRAILKIIGMNFYAEESNLNHLSKKDVLEMFPKNSTVTVKYFRFLGMRSNLMFYANLP